MFALIFSAEKLLLIHFLAQFESATTVGHQCISKGPSGLKMRDWRNGAASGQHYVHYIDT